MTPEPVAPAVRRRQCGCSLLRLLQRALVAAVLVAIVYCHGPGLFISRPASSWSSRAAVDALLGSLSPPAAAKKMRPEEVEPAVVAGSETATTTATCATVERMGEEAAAGRGSAEAAASLRVRELIRRHFEIHELPDGSYTLVPAEEGATAELDYVELTQDCPEDSTDFHVEQGNMYEGVRPEDVPPGWELEWIEDEE